MQSLHYDRYADCQYFLERVDVDAKCGLVCGEQSDEYGRHAKVILAPVYNKSRVSKISSQKALYNKYAIVADGDLIGQFTLVLNARVPSRNWKDFIVKSGCCLFERFLRQVLSESA